MNAQEGFVSHLMELRSRLIRALVAIVIVFLCLFPFASDIYDFLASPMIRALPDGTKMIATGVVAPFFIPMKITAMVAFVIALPFVLYQAWAFIAPGLYAHEKRLVLPLIVASTVLFLIGVAFCYVFVFGVVFSTIYKWAPKSISVAPDIENYLNFVLGMFMAFGITFEVPVVVVVLVRMGLVSLDKLREVRRYFIVAAFVIAAIVTPPDVLSQIMLAVPLCLLYEIGMLVARFVTPPQRPAELES